MAVPSGTDASGTVGTTVFAGNDGGALGGGGQACGTTTGATLSTLAGIMCIACICIAGAIGAMPDTHDHWEGADSQPHGATHRTHAAYAPC